MDRLGEQCQKAARLRRRRAAQPLGALVVLALAWGCSGDAGEEPKGAPPTELTDIAVTCERFDDTAQRIADAQVALYDGEPSPDDDAAVDALVAELDALKDDAPEDVRVSLTDLGSGFRTAQRLLDRPTAADRAELTELAPALAEDSQVVTAWILDECGS